MIKCFFTDLQSITMNELRSTKHSIKAAIAWINFKCYGEIFLELLNRGVKIKILLNDDVINQKYLDDIAFLNSYGAQIRLVRYSGIMHHKFCVIDKSKCLFGSFNWTNSANIRNIEDLNICDQPVLVYDYLLEFKALWELSKSDIKILRNPTKCVSCGMPLLNIMFIEQKGYYQTKIDVIQQCSCGQQNIFTDYFDISVYNNYLGEIEQFEDSIADAQQSGDYIYYNQLVSQQDHALSCYLSTVRKNRMGFPIIHAVGVKAWRDFYKNDGEWYYKIIWKERGTENYIENEYEIME